MILRITDVFDKIKVLIDEYEYYVNNHENSKFGIYISNDSIMFYLLEDEEEKDNFTLQFDARDIGFARYLELRIIIYLFGTVDINLDEENRLYNDAHRKNINIYINSDYILNKVKYMMSIQDTEYINAELDFVLELEKHNYIKRYPKQFINALDNRLYITQKVLSDK